MVLCIINDNNSFDGAYGYAAKRKREVSLLVFYIIELKCPQTTKAHCAIKKEGLKRVAPGGGWLQHASTQSEERYTYRHVFLFHNVCIYNTVEFCLCFLSLGFNAVLLQFYLCLESVTYSKSACCYFKLFYRTTVLCAH